MNLHLFIFYKDQAEDGPRLKELAQKVAEAKLTSRVHFTGPQADLARTMAWLDLGIVPSTDSEVNCRVAVEFMAAGTPVVAFPTGALPEVVAKTGIICPKPAAQELAKAIGTLLKDKPGLDKLGLAAHNRVKECYNMENFGEKLENIYLS